RSGIFRRKELIGERKLALDGQSNGVASRHLEARLDAYAAGHDLPVSHHRRRAAHFDPGARPQAGESPEEGARASKWPPRWGASSTGPVGTWTRYSWMCPTS